jgi:hypothetical protein
MRGIGILFLALGASAQVPTGTVAGVVRDPSGAALSGARLTLVNAATKIVRSETTSGQGDYSFPALLPGDYELTVQADRFATVNRAASVEAGATTTADFDLRLGDVKESVTVEATSPQMQYDSQSVSGTVNASEIQHLPLNGRNFLELAKLEPGVQTPSRATGNRTYVPVLGGPGGPSGSGTRVTVDGASIMTPGAFGASMGFSQDLVQEFQVSTADYDLSTGLTFSGAINVATRSGGNDLHGSAFYFFRDHKLSAYPALQRDPSNSDPFFQRQQYGLAVGGPIVRDRLFFFANYEHNNQRGVATTTLFGPDFAHLSSITPSPLFDNLVSLRLDDRLSSKHTLFLRYSHDGSRDFANTNGGASTIANTLPSNWVRELTWADQSLLGLTSILRPNLVNDFRFSYFFLSDDQLPAQPSDCPGCIGLGAPLISVQQAGLVLGNSSTILYPARRFETNESMSWQHGAHRVRYGVDWEHDRGGQLAWANQPASLTLFSPDQVRTYNAIAPPGMQIPLPAAFNTLSDILQLPLQSVMVGIGDPRVRQSNGSLVRTWNDERLYFQDTWRLCQSLTLNYGLGWMMDGYKDYDLTKPAFLAPILGANGLGPTQRQWKNFSPLLGFAWSPVKDRKTVIRAGAGIYYDFFYQDPDGERALLGPAGRQNIPGTAIGNPLPGIPGVNVNTPLNFTGNPTLFTAADLMSILPSLRAQLSSTLTHADPSITHLQILKNGGSVIFPADDPSWSSQHVDVGLQRELARDFVVSADFVFRHFIHGGMGPGGLDLNHYNRVINGVQTPVIPRCTAAQKNDPLAECSTGTIQVWQSTSNQTYKGLLVRADKRLSRHFQMLGSWAWSSNVGTPGSGVQNPYAAFAPLGLNLDSWHQTNRPLILDYTHIVNVAGVVELPRRFELGLNFSYSSAPPFSPIVGGIDFNGDGTTGDLLPGTVLGQFNRGFGKEDLTRLVNQFNRTYPGTLDAQRRIIPRIALPPSCSLDHNSQALDLRLSRTFVFRERWRLTLIGEGFNLYNAANLSGYTTDLTSAAFGQPNARFTQLFGSSGPRAFQLAGRLGF